MPDPVADILRTVQTSDRLRAAAWDAAYSSDDPAEVESRLRALPIGDSARAKLWDARFVSAEPEQPAAPSMGEQVVEGVKEFGRQINPLPILDSMGRALIPEAVGNAIGINTGGKTSGPLNAVNALMGAHGQVLSDAGAAFKAGDPVTGVAKSIYGSIPVIGPQLAQAGDEYARGEYGKGTGRTLGVGAVTMGPQAVANLRGVRTPAPAANKNPLEQQAVQFAEQQGIPVDAATASGSRAVRNVQKRVSETMGGAGVAEKFKAKQSEALTRVGNQLAERGNAGGPAMDPVRAGESVRGSLEARINTQAATADRAYGTLRAIEQQQPLTVNVSAAKSALKPVYDNLLRESELGIPMQGGKGRALSALDGLMRGPDAAPLSVVDAALGDLKTLARTPDLPALRTQGQGLAAQAVSALEQQVSATAQAAGPQVVQALQQGRQATIGKYTTAAARDLLSGEPAQVFRQLTAGKDVGIDRLRTIAQQTPNEIPNITRAYLEDAMEKATAEGRFQHTDRLWSDWQKLGPETKAILFKGDRGLVKDLDNFFLLAKKAGENPNPSGTAQVLTALNVGTYPVSYVLAKMLYSPSGVRALTKGLSVSLSPRARTAGTAAAVAGELSRAAQETLRVDPALTDEDSTRPQQPGAVRR